MAAGAPRHPPIRLALHPAWDKATLNAFAGNLAKPDRARAAVAMYRVFQLRELRPILRGRYEDHADEMHVELVQDSGHFIADEQPELVATGAREFFAAA